MLEVATSRTGASLLEPTANPLVDWARAQQAEMASAPGGPSARSRKNELEPRIAMLPERAWDGNEPIADQPVATGRRCAAKYLPWTDARRIPTPSRT